MDWFHQATSRDLNQWWLRSVITPGGTKPHRVKRFKTSPTTNTTTRRYNWSCLSIKISIKGCGFSFTPVLKQSLLQWVWYKTWQGINQMSMYMCCTEIIIFVHWEDLFHLTLNVREPSYLGLTRSISWLLMPWFLASPGHQHPWYWLYRIGRSLSYSRKDFNYPGHVNVEEWHKM